MNRCDSGTAKTWKPGNAGQLAAALCMLASLHAFTPAYAVEVSCAEAREAVQGWATLREALTETSQFSAAGISGVATYEGQGGVGKFHVISFAGGGFAVTSGDTEMTPILAYSHEGEFVADDENPLWCILVQDVAGRTRQLNESEDEATAQGNTAKGTSRNASAWSRLRDAANKPLPKGYSSQGSVSDLRVGPICKTWWNQSTVKVNGNNVNCYNYYTPSNYVCGCVATAFAQIMKHFEWPKEQVAVSNNYSGEIATILDSGAVTNYTSWSMSKNSNTLDPAFTGPAFGGPYRWDDMPDDPASGGVTESQRQAIGQLTRDCGIAMNMGYRPWGSGAVTLNIKYRIIDQFGYANAKSISRGNNEDDVPFDSVKKAMLPNFDLGSPCAVS